MHNAKLLSLLPALYSWWKIWSSLHLRGRPSLFFIFTLQTILRQYWNPLSHHAMSSFCHGLGSTSCLYDCSSLCFSTSFLCLFFYYIILESYFHVEKVLLLMKIIHFKEKLVFKSSILSLPSSWKQLLMISLWKGWRKERLDNKSSIELNSGLGRIHYSPLLCYAL